MALKIRIFIYILFAVTLLTECTSKNNRNQAKISGHFKSLANEWIFLEELDVHKKNLIDSVKLSNTGEFNFDISIEEPGFFIIRDDNDNFLIILLDKNETVNISSDYTSFGKGYDVFGSEDSELLRDFELFMRKQKQKVDSMSEVFYSSQYDENFIEIKAKLDTAYEEVVKVQRDYIKRFINKQPGSLASLIVINRKLGNNIVLNEEKDFIYFHRTDSALMINHPKNKHALDHHQRIKDIRLRIFDRENADKKLEIGLTAPNIVLKDTSGNYISLKDLHSQKVLIYFWAGWNAKSRLDNKTLKKIYPRLKEYNMEILGVSFDENEKVWKGALKLDNLPWKQGSDLKGLNSVINKKYNLQDKLPYYYVVDEDRKILYKEKDLDKIIKKIDELFL